MRRVGLKLEGSYHPPTTTGWLHALATNDRSKLLKVYPRREVDLGLKLLSTVAKAGNDLTIATAPYRGEVDLLFDPRDKASKSGWPRARKVFKRSLVRGDRSCAFPAYPRAEIENAYTFFRAKTLNKPVVSFCGQATRPDLRVRMLNEAEVSDEVVTRYIKRDGFFHPDIETYLNTTRQCDYVLCPPGHGNYTYRLYETLALGRVPVVIDTDVVMPLHDRIHWKHHCVWVTRSEIGHVGEIIAEHWSKLDDVSYARLQRSNMELYANLLHPASFLHAVLRTEMIYNA